MPNVIIFSKDRACQLELLLRSMKRFWPGADRHEIKILTACSNKAFNDGYCSLLVSPKSWGVWLLWQQSFKADLLSLIDPDQSFTMFLCDDNVFKDPFDMEWIDLKYFTEEILCVSLRLDPGLTYCHPAGIPNDHPSDLHAPRYVGTKTTFMFKWRGLKGDYGYPMSLDGHIFRTLDILPLLEKLQYSNPNELEAVLAQNPIDRPKMMCFARSPVMNIPLNQVQTLWKLPCGKLSAEYLNEQFLAGNIIDLEPYVGYQNMSCHEVLPVKWISNK